jgi:NADPH:quinone reductase-like Zn-dependent oxidoreductase
MKAVICSKYGPPEVLELKEVEKPLPKDNEVLVKIHATTVSTGDMRVRGFKVPPSYWLFARLVLGIKKPKNAILGTELAGEIESVGKDVKKFKKGDHIFAYPGHHTGGYAEYICIPEDWAIAKKPDNLTYEEAAAISFGGNTALHFIKQAKINTGDKILIYGASGSVGTYAVQLAKHYGAEVTGVCSTTNTELVKSLGADEVIDYTKEDFTKNGKKYDIILDAVGKGSFNGSMSSLKEEGTYIQVVATPAVSLRMRLKGLTSRKVLIGGTAVPDTDNLILLKELIDSDKIKPVIDKTYPFEEIVEAHRYVDAGHKKGNVVIKI